MTANSKDSHAFASVTSGCGQERRHMQRKETWSIPSLQNQTLYAPGSSQSNRSEINSKRFRVSKRIIINRYLKRWHLNGPDIRPDHFHMTSVMEVMGLADKDAILTITPSGLRFVEISQHITVMRFGWCFCSFPPISLF